MSKAAFSVKVFGAYLFVLGWVLLIFPNLLLAVFGIAPTGEVWIRVLGVVVVNLGVGYWCAARCEARLFFVSTIFTRVFALLVFIALALLGIAAPTLILFGVFDTLGALWTWLALRSEPRSA